MSTNLWMDKQIVSHLYKGDISQPKKEKKKTKENMQQHGCISKFLRQWEKPDPRDSML